MRVIIIGDSHTRVMASYIERISNQCQFYTVSVSSDTPSIIAAYHANLPAIVTFQPEICILHTGHNQISFHKFRNPKPIVSSTVAADTIAFANTIRQNHPNIRIILSSVFPRTYTEQSNLNKTSVLAYNKVAKRHGQRIATLAGRNHYEFTHNMPMWKKICIQLEDSSLFLRDGLHLNPAGNRAIAINWLTAINSRPQV